MYRDFRFLRIAQAICLLAVLLLVSSSAVRADEDPAGIRIDFPSDDTIPYEKIGLYIGIDRYSNLPPQSQLSGCVADAIALKEAFLRLGVLRYAMLTNAHANRAEIGQVLAQLIDQVKLAKTKTDKPITVVITYAGHGCRLKRLASENDPDPIDSSWVASDSDYQGSHDIRGYELRQIDTELAKLGAQVVIISDSCHSGEIFRGDADKQRTLIVGDNQRGDYLTRLGPQADLFPQFPLPAETVAGAGPALDGGAPLPGFVVYSACGNNQSAYETHDDQGRPCGKLSLIMRTLLANLTDETTYQELAGNVAAEFAARWPDKVSQQTPEFHAAIGKADELFFRGGYPPAHADVVAGSQRNGSLDLTMGSVLGVAEGSQFTFYASLEDLTKRRNAIATGVVDQVNPLTCRVRLIGADSVPPNARALISTVSMSDFVIGTDGDIPDFVMARLHELDANKQIELSNDPAKCSAILRYDPANKTIDMFSPGALPPVGQPDSAAPKLRAPIPCADAADADNVAQVLLYAARVQRLLSLEHNDGSLLKTDLKADNAITRDVSGMPDFSENQLFSIDIANPSDDTPMYITVFTVDKAGNLQILYPQAGEAPEALKPGKDKIIQFNATIDDRAALKPGEAELTRFKIIATDTPVDFGPLACPPEVGAANVHTGTRGPGQDSPVFDLMRDVLHGGPMDNQTRGASLAVVSQHWATANLIFGVRPAPPTN